MAMRTLKTGLTIGESPRWHDGRLWVADWLAQRIVTLDGEVEIAVGALPVSFDWLPDGRMLIVSGREGLLLRREPDGTLATHADLTALAPPPWNDIAVDGRGNAYIGYTGFDFPGGEFAPGGIALVTPDGGARRVAEGIAFPNGIAIRGDTLVIAESYGHKLTAYDIAADGGLSPGRAWAEIEGSAPDGICFDAEGAVWYADVPNQRCVRVREGGEILQTIELDRGGFACMLGGSTLYIAAAEWRGTAAMEGKTGVVYAQDVAVPHAGYP